jgi:general secretion pathway protein D
MPEDVQKVEDKVPIIGDIPLVGRAFRSNVEQHNKKNLVIFVTARIVTPAGLL